MAVLSFIFIFFSFYFQKNYRSTLRPQNPENNKETRFKIKNPTSTASLFRRNKKQSFVKSEKIDIFVEMLVNPS